MASKEALVVIIDVGSSMNDVRYNPSRLDAAREALGSIVWKKVRRRVSSSSTNSASEWEDGNIPAALNRNLASIHHTVLK